MSKGSKRYNLVLPEDLFCELKEVAERRQTSVVDLLRRFIRIGLIVAKAEETPDMVFLVREKGKEKEIMLV